MPQESSDETQRVSLNTLRTETRETLQASRVTENSPPLGVNYPELGRPAEPLFPEGFGAGPSIGKVMHGRSGQNS